MRVIFLVPAVRKPVGGVKVIYQQVAVLNQLLPPDSQAVILHPNTLWFKDRWFDNGSPQMRAFFKPQILHGRLSFSNIGDVFNAASDFVVIPEVWVRKYGVQLHKAGVPYAIYVQNGYFMNKGNRQDLDIAYANAKCILAISEDVAKCVQMAFPGTERNILRMHCSIRSDLFTASTTKENLITFMPRKLPDHAGKVLFFLKAHLPSTWRVQAISGLDEQKVAEVLSRSKVFISFSEFEGLGLPPLEAALSGNKVVGYTGQGGDEYWHPDIFTAIETGNVTGLARAVLNSLNAWEATDQLPSMQSAIAVLARTYSDNQERADLKSFIKHMLG